MQANGQTAMALRELLQLAKEVEKRMADFYQTVSFRLQISHSRLAETFTELAAEELLHAREFDMLQQLSEAEDVPLAAVPGMEASLAFQLAAISAAKERVLAAGEALSPQNVIEMSRKLEHGISETHRTFFIQFHDDRIRELFSRLSFGDDTHQKKLNDLAAL